MLKDMPPSFSHNDGPDIGFSNSIFTNKIHVRGLMIPMSFAYRSHILFGKLCGTCSLAIRTIATSFAHTISDIITLSSKKKVLGIDASWIVAVMTYMHSLRDKSAMNFPRESVSPHAASLPSDAENQFAITVRVGSSPCPTVRRFTDKTPKSHYWVHTRIRRFVIAGKTAILISLRWPRRKHATAF